MSDSPIVIHQPAPPPVAPSGVFAQIMIGACAGVVAWWLIEVLRDANADDDE